MPVRNALLLLSAALLLAVPGMATAKGKRVIVRHASQLAEDPNVAKQARLYRFVTSANTVYAKCGHEWNITDMQKQYVAEKFDRVSRDYLKAFEEAYQGYFYAPSPQELVNDYVKTMTEQQKKAIDAMLEQIQPRGTTSPKCRSAEIGQFIRSVEAMRLQDELDAKAAAEKAAAEAAQKPAAAKIPTQQPGIIPSSAPPVEETPAEDTTHQH